MKTVFVKVLVSEGLPTKDDRYYHTDIGFIDFDLVNGWMDCNKYPEYPEWWLKEVELPSDEDIKMEYDRLYKLDRDSMSGEIPSFRQGVKWLIKFLLK